MALMIRHQDAIVRDGPKAPDFNEFPKIMAHPAYDPGSLGTEVKSPSGFSHWVGGTAARLPPVTVSGADEEEYYAALGYVSQGRSDPAAFARAHVVAPSRQAYVPQEYPKWAGGVLVNSADEEAEALAARRDQSGAMPAPEPEAEQAVPGEADALKATIDGLRDDLRASDDAKRRQDAEMDAMKAQMAEMQAMMQRLAGGIPEPRPRGEKPWEARKRQAEERAGQPSPGDAA